MNREYLALSAVSQKPHRGLWPGPLSIPRPILDSIFPMSWRKGRVKGSWSAEFREQEKGELPGKPQAVQGSALPEDFLKAIVA